MRVPPAWEEGLIEKCKCGGWGGGGVVTGSRPDLLLFHLALLLGATQGRELVLGKAGNKVELPCQAPEKKNMPFIWKDSGGITIVSTFISISTSDWVKGRETRTPFRKKAL